MIKDSTSWRRVCGRPFISCFTTNARKLVCAPWELSATSLRLCDRGSLEMTSESTCNGDARKHALPFRVTITQIFYSLMTSRGHAHRSQYTRNLR